MRDGMERFVLLPFTIGCSSQSSVETNKPKSQTLPRRQGLEEGSSGKKVRNRFGLLALTKLKISNGIHKLLRKIRSFSQLFGYGEEEMEIGYPTDVKHLTHIGPDGTTTNYALKSWEQMETPQIINSDPSISLRQFELVMVAQAHGTLFLQPSQHS